MHGSAATGAEPIWLVHLRVPRNTGRVTLATSVVDVLVRATITQVNRINLNAMTLQLRRAVPRLQPQ